jgi:hypothetical protein
MQVPPRTALKMITLSKNEFDKLEILPLWILHLFYVSELYILLSVDLTGPKLERERERKGERRGFSKNKVICKSLHQGIAKFIEATITCPVRIVKRRTPRDLFPKFKNFFLMSLTTDQNKLMLFSMVGLLSLV